VKKQPTTTKYIINPAKAETITLEVSDLSRQIANNARPRSSVAIETKILASDLLTI